MADLVTSGDVEDRLGRDLTAEEDARLEFVIADACAAVRNYTGQTFTEEETTELLKISRSDVVILPQRPVTAVTAVTDHLGGDVTFSWLEGDDRVLVSRQVPDSFAWEPYRTPLSKVTVTYSHGYETVPADIVLVVCSIVLRTIGQPPTDAGITGETIDGYTYQRGSIAAAGASSLFPDERSILNTYRRVGGSIRTAW